MPRNYFETHPDFYLFHKLGSPRNLISLESETTHKLPPHYCSDQSRFANLSMSSLIEISKNFSPEQIFDFTKQDISNEEIENLERLYMSITEARIAVAKNSQDNYKDFCMLSGMPDLSQPAMYEDVSYNMQQSRILAALHYSNSQNQVSTCTVIENNKKYKRYKFANSDLDLSLGHLTKIMSDMQCFEYDKSHDQIILGSIKKERREQNQLQVVHSMGIYREEEGQEFVALVDKATAAALKNTFLESDIENKLKSAFIFTSLRGYNIRSITGACWAQEMSLRWLLEKLDFPQFRKREGIYLDIEIACLGNNPKYPESFINLECQSYKNLTFLQDVDVAETSDRDLFKKPLPLLMNEEFALYLFDSKKYREEDVEEIINILGKESLFRATRYGDENFLITANRVFARNPEMLLKLEFSMDDDNQIIENINYYNKEVEKMARLTSGYYSDVPNTKISKPKNHTQVQEYEKEMG